MARFPTEDDAGNDGLVRRPTASRCDEPCVPHDRATQSRWIRQSRRGSLECVNIAVGRVAQGEMQIRVIARWQRRNIRRVGAGSSEQSLVRGAEMALPTGKAMDKHDLAIDRPVDRVNTRRRDCDLRPTRQYGGLPNSAAITLYQDFLIGSTGLFTGGNLGSSGVSTAPVKLASGDPINVTLIYNGSTLTETLTDSITSGTFSTTYLESLSSAIGSPTAFVGFTAATSDTFSGPNQVISNFQFNATVVPEPSSLALLAAGGLGLLVVRRYRTRTT